MKDAIVALLAEPLAKVCDDYGIAPEDRPALVVERTRDSSHGDFACPIAMSLAKLAKTAPRNVAQALVDATEAPEWVGLIDIAGPGFINISLEQSAWHQVVMDVLDKAKAYGYSQSAAPQSMLIEFVSANPTGPLHVGHGRGAAYGATLANLLETQGHKVSREYYVNDAGRQMDILAASVWIRYLELCEETPAFPAAGYKGDYIYDIAASLHRDFGEDLLLRDEVWTADLPEDGVIKADAPDDVVKLEKAKKEQYIDAVINSVKKHLGKEAYGRVFDRARDILVDDIRDDLKLFGVEFDTWYSEAEMVSHGHVLGAVTTLETSDKIYTKDGALWFRSTEYGDEKDRVVTRDNGQTTYFASDIAYHQEKFERGHDVAIDIWGADHHGYIARVKGALEALNLDPKRLKILLVQFANLYRGKTKLAMSTRSGQFVTLRELRKEVGTDAARFFYVMRRADQHMDFDLELATSQSNDNPVYYVQYAHARISAVLREAAEQGYNTEFKPDNEFLEQLQSPQEAAVLRRLDSYPEMLSNAAEEFEPHQIPQYLRDLSAEFHTWYNADKFLIDNDALRSARLKLTMAVQQVLANGLALIGVSAPDKM